MQNTKKEFCALKSDALAKPRIDRSALKASGMQSVRSLARTHPVRDGAEALLCAHNIAVHSSSLPMVLQCFPPPFVKRALATSKVPENETLRLLKVKEPFRRAF